MRAYVLPDARLARLAGRVVRLDIDTEKPGNAPFVEKFPIDAWPTLLAIDPTTEQPLLRWAGTATVAQIERLILDADREMRAGRASRADAALARADRLMGERRHAEAAAAPGPIADDYPGALAEAKRLGVPLVVDVWAPW